MKTSNRASRKAGKKSPSAQSRNTPKNASGETSKETVTMQFRNRAGEKSSMELPKEFADKIKAQAAIPALHFSLSTRGANSVFYGKLAMAEWTHRFICDYARHHSIQDFNDAFRRALLYGLNVDSRKESAFNALDVIRDSMQELNFMLTAVGSLIKTISENGTPTKKYLDDLEWGVSIFSNRIHKGLEDSMTAIHQALRDPEHSHVSPDYASSEKGGAR